MGERIDSKKEISDSLDRYEVLSLDRLLADYKQLIVDNSRSLLPKDYAELVLMASEVFKQVSTEVFSVDQNKIIEKFFHETAVVQQRHNLSKTYIIVDKFAKNKSNVRNWAAFFTIRLDVLDISNLSKSQKKHFLLKGKSPNNVKQIPCILIEELAKNSKLIPNNIDMDIILWKCLEKISLIQFLAGGDVIILNSVVVDGVMKKYHAFGFVDFGDMFHPKQNKDVFYQPMYMKMRT